MKVKRGQKRERTRGRREYLGQHRAACCGGVTALKCCWLRDDGGRVLVPRPPVVITSEVGETNGGKGRRSGGKRKMANLTCKKKADFLL